MKNNSAKLQIDQKIRLHDKTHKVIGIDAYTMHNVLGRTEEWISYTLLDEDNNRTWVSTDPFKDRFIQWEQVSKEKFEELAIGPANLHLSGIATVSFTGDAGVSTPFAEIVWFDLVNKEFDSIGVERFLEQKDAKIKPLECYYNAGKIVEVAI